MILVPDRDLRGRGSTLTVFVDGRSIIGGMRASLSSAESPESGQTQEKSGRRTLWADAGELVPVFLFSLFSFCKIITKLLQEWWAGKKLVTRERIIDVIVLYI